MEYIIGRSPSSHIQIPNDFISRQHASITILNENEFEINDLNSSGGTFVNGMQIATKKITRQDKIKLANYDLNISDFIDSLIAKEKENKTDFTQEFIGLQKVYDTFMLKKKELQSKINKGKILRQMKIMIPLMLVLVGLLSVFEKLNSLYLVLSMVITSVGGLLSFNSNFKKDEANNTEMEILRDERNENYVCPKCKIGFGDKTYDFLKQRKKCINTKCNATWHA